MRSVNKALPRAKERCYRIYKFNFYAKLKAPLAASWLVSFASPSNWRIQGIPVNFDGLYRNWIVSPRSKGRNLFHLTCAYDIVSRISQNKYPKQSFPYIKDLYLPAELLEPLRFWLSVFIYGDFFHWRLIKIFVAKTKITFIDYLNIVLLLFTCTYVRVQSY